MKLTSKSVKTEVETTETVCELTQSEFSPICAEVAASTVVEFIGEDPEIDDVMAGVAMTHLLAKFAARLEEKLFGNSTTENPDKKEEK